MIAVDASAVLAIVLEEDDADRFEVAIARAGSGMISAVNYWEVLVRAYAELGEGGVALAAELFERMDIRVETADAAAARDAFRAFTRYRARPGGRLNLGDCFAYALAAREGDGLLFKGDDFPKTDVKRVLS